VFQVNHLEENFTAYFVLRITFKNLLIWEQTVEDKRVSCSTSRIVNGYIDGEGCRERWRKDFCLEEWMKSEEEERELNGEGSLSGTGLQAQWLKNRVSISGRDKKFFRLQSVPSSLGPTQPRLQWGPGGAFAEAHRCTHNFPSRGGGGALNLRLYIIYIWV
jgi:hypothetical protein